MLRNKIIFQLLIFLFLCSESFANKSLTVFAEGNMSSAIIEITRLFSKKNHITVSINFNTSSELVSAIDSGESVDMVITANNSLTELLKKKGLVDIYNTAFIAKDHLVLATFKDNESIEKFSKSATLNFYNALFLLNKNRSKLIIDSEETSSGEHSYNLFRRLNLREIKLFRKIKEDRNHNLFTNFEDNDKFFLVLSSQTFNNSKLAIISEEKEESVYFQALVIAGDNMETAREFLRFLKSPICKDILIKNGFRV